MGLARWEVSDLHTQHKEREAAFSLSFPLLVQKKEHLLQRHQMKSLTMQVMHRSPQFYSPVEQMESELVKKVASSPHRQCKEMKALVPHFLLAPLPFLLAKLEPQRWKFQVRVQAAELQHLVPLLWICKLV
uniref:Uncharacterized protein n=1 Tax=Opuntia streptacantha TaxID=393608 RepID=A0A7C9EGV9_OPUST